MSLSFFKKKGYPIGTKRDYGRYGVYKKQEDGTWKRLKKGYPMFRRTLSFALMKGFLMEYTGWSASYFDSFSAPSLRKMIKRQNLNSKYEKWLEDHDE